jgi:hypothetical protein
LATWPGRRSNKSATPSACSAVALHSLPANALYTGFIDRDNAVEDPKFAD